MTTYSFVICIILFAIVLLLMKLHNWLMRDVSNALPETLHLMVLAPREKAIIYLVLAGGSLLLMFSLTGFSPFSVLQWEMTIAVSVALATSFFLPYTLHSLLDAMKRNKQLSCDLLGKQKFWLSTYLIIFTELSFLNWIKEVTTYFNWSFLLYVMGYMIIILVAELLILWFSQRLVNVINEIQEPASKVQFDNFSIKRQDKQSFSRWLFNSPQAIIDSLIVVVLSIILLHVTLELILLLGINQ
jgi:hypothetical protein